MIMKLRFSVEKKMHRSITNHCASLVSQLSAVDRLIHRFY